MKAKTQRIRPILRWQGGKSRLLKQLIPLIPPHVCYCEPCAGGLAMLLAKPRSPVEVINDLNGDLVALYRTLQFHLPELLRQLDFMVGSRENLRDFVSQPGLTEIQRAARFYIKNRTSFAGNMNSFAVSKTRGGGGGFDHRKSTELLEPAHERLNGVVVEHLSYERCLRLYDAKDTFFFIDPPYLNSEAAAYRGWNEAEMTEFRGNVGKLQGRWLVTVDDSELNRELFKDCKVRAVTTANRSVNQRTTKSATFGELIITPE